MEDKFILNKQSLKINETKNYLLKSYGSFNDKIQDALTDFFDFYQELNFYEAYLTLDYIKNNFCFSKEDKLIFSRLCDIFSTFVTNGYFISEDLKNIYPFEYFDNNEQIDKYCAYEKGEVVTRKMLGVRFNFKGYLSPPKGWVIDSYFNKVSPCVTIITRGDSPLSYKNKQG